MNLLLLRLHEAIVLYAMQSMLHDSLKRVLLHEFIAATIALRVLLHEYCYCCCYCTEGTAA